MTTTMEPPSHWPEWKVIHWRNMMEISKINKFTCNPKDIHKAVKLAFDTECFLKPMAEHFCIMNSEGRSFELCHPEFPGRFPRCTPSFWAMFKSVGYDPQVPSKAVVPSFVYAKGPIGQWDNSEIFTSIGNKHIDSQTDFVNKKHRVTFNKFFTYQYDEYGEGVAIGGKWFNGITYYSSLSNKTLQSEEAKKHVARLCLRAVFLKFFKLHSIAFFWLGITVEKEGLAVFEEDGTGILLGEGAKRLREEFKTGAWVGKKQKSV